MLEITIFMSKTHQFLFISSTMWPTKSNVQGSIYVPVWYVIPFARMFIFSFMNLFLKSVHLGCDITSREMLFIAYKKVLSLSYLNNLC